LGGTAPVATGIALSEKIRKRNTLTILFLGDGALGEGVVYESLNMAALWSVPILFVVENNQIAQTTPIDLNFIGEITSRFESFGIESEQTNSCDVIEINNLANQLIEKTRVESSPHAFVINTHRFGPHSKGDDTRSEQEIQDMKNRWDPISIHAIRMNSDQCLDIERSVTDEIDKAYVAALAAPMSQMDVLSNK
jgi:TPP-dependent pyruvate/acetoin dehydrogenase alpha subunit